MNTTMPTVADMGNWLERIGIRRVAASCVSSEAFSRDDARHRAWSRRHGHAHSAAELLIALQGTTVSGSSNGPIRTEPGTLVVFAPGEWHDVGYPPWTPEIEHLWIRVVPNRSFAHWVAVRDGRMRSLGPSRVLESTATGVDLFRVLELLRGPMAPRSAALRRGALVAAVTTGLTCLATEALAVNPSVTRHADRLDAICRHLDETAGRGASAESLARLAGLSTFHFVRLFRRHAGQTLLGYINRARQARVRELRARGEPCKVIAEELGFSCPASFSRWRQSR